MAQSHKKFITFQDLDMTNTGHIGESLLWGVSNWLCAMTYYVQDIDVLCFQDVGGGGRVALCPDASRGGGPGIVGESCVIRLEHETMTNPLHRLPQLTDYVTDADVLQDVGGRGHVALCPDDGYRQRHD